MKKYQRMTLSLLACGFTSSLQAANLITNGSFEANAATILTQTTAQQPGWNYVKDTYFWGGQVFFGRGSNWNVQGTDTPFTASEGVTIAVVNGTDWGTYLVSSPISLTAGQQYTFSFDTRLLSAYNGDYSAAISPSSSMKLAVALHRNNDGDPNNFNYVDSRIVVDNLSSWNSNSFTFTSARNDSDVRVSVYTLNGDNQFSHVFSAVDNFQLTAVPEPSSFALAFGGIANLLLIRRRVRA
jgi:hypothetical protein